MQEVKSHLDFCFESLSRHIQFNFKIKRFTSSLKLLKRDSLNSSTLILTIAVWHTCQQRSAKYNFLHL